MSTSTTIRKLEDRYPFSKEELEVLVRCYDLMSDEKNPNDFIMTLAKASPYSVFFLPGDELQKRVVWIETNILPSGFSSQLHCTLMADTYVDLANQGVNRSLEAFIEGIADTGRRGCEAALRVIYDLHLHASGGDASPLSLIELCVCMAIASEAMVIPEVRREILLKRLEDAKAGIEREAQSLQSFCKNPSVGQKDWIRWADATFPHLSSTLSTFVHRLLFHRQAYPAPRIPYSFPHLCQESTIFETETSPYLTTLSLMNDTLGTRVSLKAQ